MTTVKEIRTIATNWLDENIDNYPDIIGAFLSGALAYMRDDEEFPFFSDIDIKIVVEDSSNIERLKDKEIYEGFILEWGVVDKKIFISVDAFLLDPYIAQQLLRNNILLDKDDFLSRTQEEVERRYHDPVIVKKRCLKWFLGIVRAIKDNNRSQAGYRMAQTVVFASCSYVTVRRILEVAYESLQVQNRIDFHEYILEVFGSKEFTKSDVLQNLDNLMYAFDFVVSLTNQQDFGESNIQAHNRPYVYYGTMDMIERGRHRESVFWIYVIYNSIRKIIEHAQDNGTKKLILNHFADFSNRLGHPIGSQNVFVGRLAPNFILREIDLYLQQQLGLSCRQYLKSVEMR